MYPITNEVKALFEAEQTKVLRITGSTVKILPTDISVYNGNTLVYQSGDSKRVKLYSGTTEVFDSDGTQTIILYSGDTPIYINDEAGMPVNLTITSDNVKANTFVIDRYSCNGQKLEIGTAVASQMKLRLDNHDGFYDGIVLEGVEFFVEIGIADWTQENPTVTYIPCGYFTSCVQPRKLSTIELTCLDRMTRFDKEVDATALTFPATVANLVGQVCTICSMPFNQSLTALPNYNYSITELPTIDGAIITYRNLIQWCAGLMGTNAFVDWNGYLQFTWYTNSTGYVSTIDNRYNSDLYENAITITGVEYTDSDEARTVYLAGTDDYALDVSNNGFINANNAATVLAGIYSAVQSFVYTPFTASVIAAPYLWPMDRITFTDKTGHTYISLLTNVNFGLNGTTGLAAIGETEELNNGVMGSGFTAQQLQELKNIKQITSDNLKNAVDAATALITGADGGHVRFMYNSDGELTEILIMDTDDITTATKVWRWNSGGLGYSSNGYAGPYTLAMTQNGAIVANFITAGEMSCDRLQGGMLTLGGANNGNGVMQVLDAFGNIISTMNNAGIDINKGSIKNYSTDGYFYDALDSGALRFYVNMGKLEGGNDRWENIGGILGGLNGSIPLFDRSYIGLSSFANLNISAAGKIHLWTTGTPNSHIEMRGDTINITGSLTINGYACASGTFTTADGKTVTVRNGLITAIT